MEINEKETQELPELPPLEREYLVNFYYRKTSTADEKEKEGAVLIKSTSENVSDIEQIAEEKIRKVFKKEEFDVRTDDIEECIGKDLECLDNNLKFITNHYEEIKKRELAKRWRNEQKKENL